MDISAFIEPIIKAAQRRSSSNSNIGLDRALGTVASLTLTIGLCRILSAAYKKGIGNESNNNDVKVGHHHHHQASKNNEHFNGNANNCDGGGEVMGIGTGTGVYELVKIILRSVLMGDGVKRITNGPGEGVGNKEYSGLNRSVVNRNRIRTTTAAENNNGHNANDDSQDSDSDSNTIVSMMGSCHCKAVSFILKAPKNIIAQDCHGKIRYPHHITKADNFQLVCGTPYLSVYYVDLSQEGHGHNNVIAAHTFCSRCGVHILRAPNSHSDKLEINTNCLDEVRARDGNGIGMGENSGFGTNVNVYEVEDRNGTGLSAGKAAMEFMRKVEYEKTLMERDTEEAESVLELGKIAAMSCSEDDSLSLDNSSTNWGQSMAERWKRQHQQQQFSVTPLTVSSSLPSVLAGDSVVSESEVDSASDGLSYDGSAEGTHLSRVRRGVSPAPPHSNSNGGWISKMNSDSSFSLPRNPFGDDNRSVASASTIGNGSTTGNGSLAGDDNDNGKNVYRRKKLLPPSSTMNDQLKYYMKKHLASPTIQEDR